MPKFSANITAVKETTATYEVQAQDEHEAHEEINKLARDDFPDATYIEVDEVLDEEQTALLNRDVSMIFDQTDEEPLREFIGF